MSIDLYYDSDCPLAAGVRDDLRSVLDEAGLDLRVVEHVDEGRLSPTLLVDGRDVVAERPPGRGCRTDRPSREQLRAAVARLGNGAHR